MFEDSQLSFMATLASLLNVGNMAASIPTTNDIL